MTAQLLFNHWRTPSAPAARTIGFQTPQHAPTDPRQRTRDAGVGADEPGVSIRRRERSRRKLIGPRATLELYQVIPVTCLQPTADEPRRPEFAAPPSRPTPRNLKIEQV